MSGDTGAARVQEIEVKYRLFDLPGLERALVERGLVLSAPIFQDDQAYAHPDWAYGQSKIGVPFARLRTQDGRHLFTVKTPLANELACLEHESEVADRDQMHQAILQMGFQPTVRIVKTRRTAHVAGMALCVDEVEHAGQFLEIEKVLDTNESGTAAQEHLDTFARSFGVALERTTDTYDSLVRAALAPA
ncbi:class IV adenylate cyclase [Acrocarpospora macrocephala]|uniref:class IV adenylate cyclase n=1 Tax=Acrocarpospora macrocephala TaxID=150177 RepID=UPI001FEBE99A|nr:class IV adenylate cyclase [Acrocarpospora macrocephala]